MATTAGSFGLIEDDTKVCEKLLHRGHPLLIPSRQLHYNKDVFGDDAAVFNPGRCPGRFVTQQQTSLFVALLLHRFDIELAGPPKFP